MKPEPIDLDAMIAGLLAGRRVELAPTTGQFAPYVQGLLQDPVISYSLSIGRPGAMGGDHLGRLANEPRLAEFVVVQTRTGRPVGWVIATRPDLWSGTCYVTLAFERRLELRAWPLEGATLFLRYLRSEFRIHKVFFEVAEYAMHPLVDALARHGGRVELRKPQGLWALGRHWDVLTVGLDIGEGPRRRAETATTAAASAAKNDESPSSLADRMAPLVGRRSLLRPLSDQDTEDLWRIFSSSRGLWFRSRGIPHRPSQFEEFMWRGTLVQFGVASRDESERLRGVHVAYGYDPLARTAYVASIFDVDTPSFYLLDSSALFLHMLFDRFPIERLFFDVAETTEFQFATALGALERVGVLEGRVVVGTEPMRTTLLSLTREAWMAQAREVLPRAVGPLGQRSAGVPGTTS